MKKLRGLGVLLTVGIIIGLVIFKEEEKQKKVLNIYGFNDNREKSMAIYIKDENGNYNKTNSIPIRGYTLDTTKSICTNNAIPSWNTKTNSLKINNLTSNTRCYLYFEEFVEPSKKTLDMLGLTATEGPTEFTGISASDEARILSSEDDDGTTYYFRGNVTNNWVSFAGFYWRIIRINGDGSIRMIYNGTTTDQTGAGTQLQTSAYNANYNDNAYVGYMYGSTGASTYATTHANTNNSTIKGIVDSWYKTNIEDKGHSNKISTVVGFCNDRKVDKTASSSYHGDGYRTNATAYGPWRRILKTDGNYNSEQTPSFKCSQVNSDLFTASSSTKGNKKLTYPVGLITADEVIYAGGFGGLSNSSYYLYTNQDNWTITPCNFSGGDARMFRVNSNGYLGGNNVSNSNGVRPVINLSTDVKLTGNGTVSDPYKVV